MDGGRAGRERFVAVRSLLVCFGRTRCVAWQTKNVADKVWLVWLRDRDGGGGL